MKSVRLSHDMREQILAQMIESYKQNNPAPKSKVDAENDAFEALWNNAFSKYDFSKIPDEFFKKDNDLSATFEGVFVKLHHHARKFPLMDTSYNPVPVKAFDKNPKFYTDYVKAVDKFTTWEENLKSFKSELRSILWSCGTTKQLVDIWPESKQYLPNGIADIQTKNLPALKTAELNKKLCIK